jgi:hypothetical protein
MNWFPISLIGLLVIASSGQALELTITSNPGSTIIQLSDIAYPDDIDKDLQSGLTTTLLIQIDITAQDGATEHYNRAVSIRYDLWEENYIVDSDFLSATSTLTDLQQIRDLIDTFEILLAELKFIGEKYAIKTTILLNPIDRERMELIRQFIAENSIPGDSGSRNSRNPEKFSLFNIIFEQYTRGANIGATWSETAIISWSP